MTTSPNIFTSTPPFSISTNLVRISLIALLLALTSIAHTPSMTTGVFGPVENVIGVGDGEFDVSIFGWEVFFDGERGVGGGGGGMDMSALLAILLER
jgi:hypothetical protein